MKSKLFIFTIFVGLSVTSFASTWNEVGTIETKVMLDSNYIQFDEKCYIITDGSAKKIEIPQGTKSKVNILFIEKEVDQDSDSLNKSASTQIILNLENPKARISVACHSSGILFPTAGLPTVQELIKQVIHIIEIR
jgi:hypothetical protein